MADASLYDLRLINEGDADVSLPALVRIDSSCDVADGIRGYALQRTPKGLFLQRVRVGSLRAGREMSIGWLRCVQGPVMLQLPSS